MRKLKLLIGLLFLPLFAQATHSGRAVEGVTTEVIDYLSHSRWDDFITTAYIYDHERGIVCVSAAATRKGGGLATSNKCYRSEEEPHFKAENSGFYPHRDGDAGTRNSVTVFRIIDETNNKICYGTLS